METARKAALGDATAILGRQSVPAGGQRTRWDWLDRVSKGAPWRQAASCRVWRGICYRMVIYLNPQYHHRIPSRSIIINKDDLHYLKMTEVYLKFSVSCIIISH